MQLPFSRRQFLHRSLSVSIAATVGPFMPSKAGAFQPIRRPGRPRLLLGLAAYSFRDYFKDSDQKRAKAAPESEQMDMFKFVDYCAEHGCDGAELTSYYFPSDLTAEYLIELKRHAFLRGIAISGSAIGNTFTH